MSDMVRVIVPRPKSNQLTENSHELPVSTAPINLSTAIKDFPYIERFRQITNEMADLYAKKNADYGNSFAKSIEEFGLIAGLVRLSDKWNRVCELVKNNGDHQVANESLKDTAIDGACYFIMLAMEIERLSNQITQSAIEFGIADSAQSPSIYDHLTNDPAAVQADHSILQPQSMRVTC